MIPFWIAFAAGVFVGVFLGIWIISIPIIGRRAENDYRRRQ